MSKNVKESNVYITLPLWLCSGRSDIVYLSSTHIGINKETKTNYRIMSFFLSIHLPLPIRVIGSVLPKSNHGDVAPVLVDISSKCKYESLSFKRG